jgi:hypothetical protein
MLVHRVLNVPTLPIKLDNHLLKSKETEYFAVGQLFLWVPRFQAGFLPIRKYESNNILVTGRNTEMIFCDFSNIVYMFKMILLTIYLISYISEVAP